MKPWLQECVLKAQYCLFSEEAASIRFIVFFFAHNRGVINRTGYANLSRGSGITSGKFMEVHSVRLLICYTVIVHHDVSFTPPSIMIAVLCIQTHKKKSSLLWSFNIHCIPHFVLSEPTWNSFWQVRYLMIQRTWQNKFIKIISSIHLETSAMYHHLLIMNNNTKSFTL